MFILALDKSSGNIRYGRELMQTAPAAEDLS